MGNIYDQLSLEERTMIQTQLEMGIKPAAIANGLNRPASTRARANGMGGSVRRPVAAPGVRPWRAATVPTGRTRVPVRARVRRAWFAAYDRDLHGGLRSSTI